MALPPSRLPLPVSPPAAADFFRGGRFGFADFFAGASDSSADSSSEAADLDDFEREEAREVGRSCSESSSGTMKSSSSEALDFFFVAVHMFRKIRSQTFSYLHLVGDLRNFVKRDENCERTSAPSSSSSSEGGSEGVGVIRGFFARPREGEDLS
jgi:hypothetical protein